jgi:hypothetical protein
MKRFSRRDVIKGGLAIPATSTFTKDDWARGVPVGFSGSQSVEILEVSPVH